MCSINGYEDDQDGQIWLRDCVLGPFRDQQGDEGWRDLEVHGDADVVVGVVVDVGDCCWAAKWQVQVVAPDHETCDEGVQRESKPRPFRLQRR